MKQFFAVIAQIAFLVVVVGVLGFVARAILEVFVFGFNLW